ncbi:50S ribosomal protein L35 [candidate division TM6 bacterium RIFCSPHIGHO2_12_FULL_32_22]|nr:MAG: 50S ribosomal protein L35 [candidate division TM6 bacterium RIFCSPHIGHO2_12_FULL_32_22]
MPKTKTRSSAKKRFKKTSSGKVKFSGAFRRHMLSKKTKKAKRRLKKAHYVHEADHARVTKMLPY